MSESAVADYLRAHKAEISDEWERLVVSDSDILASMERGVLLDHLPEVLDGLACWLEGDTGEAERAFSVLADGHALQRLGFGVELAVLNREYALLRRVVLRVLLAVPSSPQVRESLITLNEGLDRAIDMSVRRYSERREYRRDRFVGILGHDLRDPVNAITMASAHLLRSNTMPDEERRLAAIIGRAATRMGRMIGDILDFARGHLGGGIPAHPRECDMGQVCRLAVDEARSSHPDRSIELNLAGDLLGTFDPDRALQVIVNLVGNGIKHGRDPVVVSAWEAEDRRALFTSVESHGAPIPRHIADRIFDPFTHAADTKKGGLGLGLYIVAQVARAHGATCEVDSSEEKTTFTIRWPRTPRGETHDRP